MQFNFQEKKNTMVITTKNILERKKEIILVSHDEDDGMWEFLDGDDVEEEQAVIVSLFEVFKLDETIGELYDLPIGWIAVREGIDSQWERYVN